MTPRKQYASLLKMTSLCQFVVCSICAQTLAHDTDEHLQAKLRTIMTNIATDFDALVNAKQCQL